MVSRDGVRCAVCGVLPPRGSRQFLSDECVQEDVVAAWRQLENAQKQGKARSIGVSNCTTRSLEAILAQCEVGALVDDVQN